MIRPRHRFISAFIPIPRFGRAGVWSKAFERRINQSTGAALTVHLSFCRLGTCGHFSSCLLKTSYCWICTRGKLISRCCMYIVHFDTGCCRRGAFCTDSSPNRLTNPCWLVLKSVLQKRTCSVNTIGRRLGGATRSSILAAPSPCFACPKASFHHRIRREPACRSGCHLRSLSVDDRLLSDIGLVSSDALQP